MEVSKCSSPFDIDIVLKMVLKDLSSDALVAARLVSKRWEEFATDELKKRRDLLVKLTCRTIQEFTSVMENSQSLPPFTCYELKCVYYGDETFQKFLQISGDSVKRLRFVDFLTHSQIRGCSRLKPLLKLRLPVEADFLQNVVHKLGNILELLEFDLMPFPRWKSGIKVKVQVTFGSKPNGQIVKLSFPELESLQLQCAVQNLKDFCSSAFSFSNSLANSPNNEAVYMDSLKSNGILSLVSKLKSYEICDHVVQTLLDSDIALEELDLYNNPICTSVDIFESFLKMQSKSLKVLSLTNATFRRSGFPTMPQLTELHLKSNWSYESVIHFLGLEGLDLFRDLPKLKILSLTSQNSFVEYDRRYSSSLISSKRPIVPFEKLHSLHFSLGRVNLLDILIPYFGEQFPKITKLTLSSATSAMLKTVFAVGAWGLSLKELKVEFAPFLEGQEYRDCGICGFPSEWRRSSGRKLLMDKDQAAFLREAEAWNRRPGGAGGITQFPNLEKLSFGESGWKVDDAKRINIFISDLAIYFSLVKLKHLATLSICGEHTITPEAVHYLRGHSGALRSVVIKEDV